jgi:hypothetical protein
MSRKKLKHKTTVELARKLAEADPNSNRAAMLRKELKRRDEAARAADAREAAPPAEPKRRKRSSAASRATIAAVLTVDYLQLRTPAARGPHPIRRRKPIKDRRTRRAERIKRINSAYPVDVRPERQEAEAEPEAQELEQ